MGVTKQAARKRFQPKDPGAVMDPNEGFERFTLPACNVVLAAHNEAKAARSAEITPAHLVLGLLNEPDAIAAKAIVEHGIALDDVRAAAVAALPAPVEGEVPELIAYDGDARKALELTFRGALRLGHNYIGTEHVLLTLLEQEGGEGTLWDLGIDKDETEDFVLRTLAAITPPTRSA